MTIENPQPSDLSESPVFMSSQTFFLYRWETGKGTGTGRVGGRSAEQSFLSKETTLYQCTT